MLRKLRSICITSLAAAALSITATPAFADSISLALTQAKQSANPGSTVSFNAIISAPSNNSTDYYLSDNFDFNPSPATLKIVDDAFVSNFFNTDFFPGTSQTSLLFTVALPANLATGAYTGFFEVFDGTDFNTANVKSTATFEIDVPASASPVPEPSTWTLLATGLTLGLAAFTLNRRSAHATNPIA